MSKDMFETFSPDSGPQSSAVGWAGFPTSHFCFSLREASLLPINSFFLRVSCRGSTPVCRRE
jgi:hypothetical protein